jgi:hypothetical protein
LIVDQQTDYISAQVRALIGYEAALVEAPHAVEESEVRRFFQATMDDDPQYSGDGSCSAYGRPVAPPAFVIHMFRRHPADLLDPLARSGDPDFDGQSRRMRPNLPPLPIPLPRIVNGGYEHEFYSYAFIGERVTCRTRYSNIYQRTGKQGPLVCVVIVDEFATTSGRALLRSTNTHILR